MMKSLPHKIFNRCKRIPFNTTIYTTREKRDYTFCGIRDRRITNESVLYSVPNNKSPQCPNIKGFQREEMDNLWYFLLTTKSLSIQDIESKYPALIKEGKCCFAAFYGLINFLFPNQFTKSKSKINLKPNK